MDDLFFYNVFIPIHRFIKKSTGHLTPTQTKNYETYKKEPTRLYAKIRRKF